MLDLPVSDPGLVRDAAFGDRLRELEVDLLLNVHSLAIVAPEVLTAPRIGAFNLHPGPLPGYAGLNVPSWALAAGEREHGVTLHWMTAGIDEGDVAYRDRFPISERETGASLSARCARRGLSLVERLLGDAAADGPPREGQDLAAGRYLPPGPPHGGRLPWALPAASIERLVRAADFRPFASPWGSFGSRVGDREFGVLEAATTAMATDRPPGTVGARSGDDLLVAAGDEWLALRRVEIAGEGALPGAALEGLGECCDPGPPARSALGELGEPVA